MAYEIGVAEGEGLVKLRFHGRGDHSEHAAARDEALEICRKHKINGVLVDNRDAVMDMSVRELFQFGKSFEGERVPLNIRLAVVIREKDKAPDMAAAVAQARNVKVRVFLTEEEARYWLMK
jgi:hypothetical protein